MVVMKYPINCVANKPDNNILGHCVWQFETPLFFGRWHSEREQCEPCWSQPPGLHRQHSLLTGSAFAPTHLNTSGRLSENAGRPRAHSKTDAHLKNGRFVTLTVWLHLWLIYLPKRKNKKQTKLLCCCATMQTPLEHRSIVKQGCETFSSIWKSSIQFNCQSSLASFWHHLGLVLVSFWRHFEAFFFLPFLRSFCDIFDWCFARVGGGGHPLKNGFFGPESKEKIIIDLSAQNRKKSIFPPRLENNRLFGPESGGGG